METILVTIGAISATGAVIIYVILFAVTWGFLAIRHARKTGDSIEDSLLLHLIFAVYWPLMWIALLIELAYHLLTRKQETT